LAALLLLLFLVDDLAALLLLQRDAGGLLEEHRGGRALDPGVEAAVGGGGDDQRHGECAQPVGPVGEARPAGGGGDGGVAPRRAAGQQAEPAWPSLRSTANGSVGLLLSPSWSLFLLPLCVVG